MKTDFSHGWNNNYHRPHNIYVNYYSNLIDQCTGDSRKLFCGVNSLSREVLVMALNPEHDDPIKLANKFGTFFRKKIEIIKENLDNLQVQEPRLVPAFPKTS